MSLSKLSKYVRSSATLKLTAKFAVLKQQGEPVIHLGGGEPVSKAPADAIKEAVDLISTGEVRYSPVSGVPQLKNAIIDYTEKFYHRKVEQKNVMAASGAKHVIMVALQAILDPADEVIFPAPYWVSYPDMVRLCYAEPVPVLASDGSFYPTVNDIEKKISGKTKAIIINSPNNPSGAMYSEEFIAKIVELCERKDIYLIMDDIYHQLIFDNRKPISCYDYTKKSVDDSKIIVINGVSKLYAMTGFRLGWGIASKEVIEFMTTIQGHQTSGSSIIAQRAAIGALNGEQNCVEELRKYLQTNRDVLVENLQPLDGVKISKPDGTFYCFVDFSHFEKDSTKLSDFLIDKVRVLAVPGVEFGMEGYLRLSTAGAEQDIVEGIKRIKWAFDPDSPKEYKLGEKIIIKDWL